MDLNANYYSLDILCNNKTLTKRFLFKNAPLPHPRFVFYYAVTNIVQIKN